MNSTKEEIKIAMNKNNHCNRVKSVKSNEIRGEMLVCVSYTELRASVESSLLWPESCASPRSLCLCHCLLVWESCGTRC